jgi:hypothetical protein
MTDKIKGPESYFPSIERTYGYPVGHWIDLIAEKQAARHMEVVAWLKSAHGLGHGHANALVAHTRAPQKD